MITTNEIETIDNDTIRYIDVNHDIYRYETWEPMSKEQLEAAKSQFAMILNILLDRPNKSIEKHMKLNGFDGFADVYDHFLYGQ